MCNYRHSDPRRVWEVGSEPQSLTPFRSLRRPQLTNSKNGQTATIRVTSELARSEDPFVRCAGCGVGQGRRAPVHARASQNQLPSEKHICFGRLFCVFLPNGAQRLVFSVNYHLREDQVFTILTPKWPNSTSGPRGASGIQCGQNLTQSGSNLIPIG